MRFALRNQTKIKNAIGEELFSELMETIKETFTERCDTDIMSMIDSAATPFPTLTIDGTDSSFNFAVLYVTGRMYDVLHLAFKEIHCGFGDKEEVIPKINN